MVAEANLEGFLFENAIPEHQETYRRIKSAVKDIWAEPRLNWYTDHGINHSERIILHLNRLCAGLLSVPGSDNITYGLTPEEVFLLLSASWLHDIGMQDLTGLNNHSVDEMDEKDWKQVRERHPQKAFEMIMGHPTEQNNNFWTGIILDSNIRAPLALICKGHGSNYFTEVINIFRGDRTFDISGNGKSIRGDLLTALLLMADELDLHQNRAVFKKNYPLSIVSKLHHFRHHYIGKVEIISNPDGKHEIHRKIRIIYHFPNEKDPSWMNDMQKWVQDKIEKEAERTKSILHGGFHSHFLWSDPLIEVKVETAFENEKYTMEKAVQCLLASEIQKPIDWKDIIPQFSDRFKKGAGGVVCVKGSKESAVERFIDFIQYIFGASVKGNPPIFPFAVLDFSEPEYQVLTDVFQEIETQLGDIKPKQGNQSIIQYLKSEGKFYLVIFKHLEHVGKELIDSLQEVIQSCNQHAGNLFLLITTGQNLSILNDLTTFTLPEKFEAEDIYQYFLETGDTEDDARLKLNGYLDFMKLKGTVTPFESFPLITILNQTLKREVKHGVV
ncbi:MAG: hypothetical protein ACM3SY_04690 [Candidatus Omnitrophota bacterium]